MVKSLGQSIFIDSSGNTTVNLNGTIIKKDPSGGIVASDASNNTLDGTFNNIDVSGNATINGYAIINGNLMPNINLVYDLGTPDKRWNDLYLSGNTIDLSGTLLSRHTDGSLMVHDSNNNMVNLRANNIIAEGSIGVGTENPQYKMHVIGDTRIYGNLTVNGTQIIVDTSVNTTERLQITNDGTGPALIIDQLGNQSIMEIKDDGNIVLHIADGGIATFSSNILANANVGIGTNNPMSQIHTLCNYNNTIPLKVEQSIIDQEYPPTSISNALFIPDYMDTIQSIDISGTCLVEYPPPFIVNSNTINVAGAMYGNGTYSISTSSVNASYNGYFAFDKNIVSTSQWQSATSTYNTSTPFSASSGGPTVVSGTSYTGSWIQIQMPSNIIVKKYSLTHYYVGSGEALPPSEWILAGWNGANWITISLVSFIINQDSTYTVDVSSNTGSYASYRLIVTKIIGNNSRVGINEIRFYANTVLPNIREFPPEPLTNFTTTLLNTYGSGTYVVSASSVYSNSNDYYAYNAFNKTFIGTGGVVGAGTYTANTTYTGTTKTTAITNIPYNGEWIQIKLPLQIKLYSYSLTPQSATANVNVPTTWYVLGSTNEIIWNLLDTRVSTDLVSSGSTRFYIVNSLTPYSYFRFVCNVTSGITFTLGEWQLFGDIISRYPKYKATIPFNSIGYGYGPYVVYSNTMNYFSSLNDPNPTRVFNKTASMWSTLQTTYTSSIDALETPVFYFEFPNKINITSYQMKASTFPIETPSKWVLYGSINGSSWDVINTQSSITDWTSGELKVFTLPLNTSYYKYYRFDFIRNSSVSQAKISLDEVKCYGINEVLETRLTIASNGNIGIGTSIPQTTLDIQGNVYLNGTIIITDKFMAVYSYLGAEHINMGNSFVFPLQYLTLNTYVSLLSNASQSNMYDNVSKGFVAPYSGIYHLSFSFVHGSGSNLSNCQGGFAPYNCLGNGTSINMQTALIFSSSSAEIVHVSGTLILSAGNIIVPVLYVGNTLVIRGSGGNTKFIVTLLHRTS